MSALAGCSGLSGRVVPSRPRLESVHVANRTFEPRTVHVLVECDDSLATWSSVALPPATAVEGEDGPVPRADPVRLQASWPTDTDAVTVHARVDDRDSWVTDELDPSGRTESVVEYEYYVRVVDLGGGVELSTSAYV